MKRFFIGVGITLIILLCSSVLFAGERGTFFIRGAIGGGGIEDIPLHMETENGTALAVNSFNGLNLGISAGYNFSPLLSAELQTGSMKMSISPKPTNGDGYFKTTPLLLLLNYKLLHRDMYDFYVAGGAAWFFSPELHREGPGVTDTIKYETAAGPYLAAGWDFRFDPKWSIYVELGVPLVTYKFSSGTENGVAIAAPFSDWDNISGGAVFYIGIGYNY
ncbi:MAG: outer membrane beta-barrel protein [bacterium]|nr:outer membrane beta-barrel protein [bacterium]